MTKSFFKKTIAAILELEAKLLLWKYHPRIVAVTGSVGKTSTKDALHTIFSAFFFVRKSQKSFNSELGVPLTILGFGNGWNNPLLWAGTILRGLIMFILPHEYPKWLILEVGADRPGDIKRISKWLFSDVVVITRLSKVPVHVEFFASPEKVVEEKASLIKTLREGGTLVLNADDDDVNSLQSLYRGGSITFGFAKESAFRASHYKILYAPEKEGGSPLGITFKVEHENNCFPVSVKGVIGKQHVYPALAALTAGFSRGLNMIKMIEAYETHAPASGRMRLIMGIKNTTIIDDTYNASPVALFEALESLQEIKSHGRKIAVLGDMLELGKYSIPEHKEAGNKAAGVANFLVTVGIRARDIAEGALQNGMDEEKIIQFEYSKDAGVYLQNILQVGDTVLVKGSQGMRMERVVEEIMANPDQASELLVRQEREWKRR
ncbi:MAG: hypothetical protein A2836_01470 [Candidatus Taylorbacteria bacterium RIFCSPHIGHO2_01_FULL_45_63]|uniref:UDP-N-acetylmuramoyl-tripeptide--D-alanyl-D-alanine ligase n=1 Tax=Candidatus Taylorbacteria bacterium RIFCSPHIGHO2_02_FULL_45_35 TaxID=1802311 RepID=A0A1G2MYS7_9BACT|nr:MAG: hypothetical protein A2836_01470 [Candidatus Taylorbacteria bacterium RIFCSPHIGHO2_01_FULL_45_63]OHA28081.1 MAG: hypothetical protein A3D56_00175 [Candidatus Taylorbacteria bacterium RIFCSPHIGHO2_02_FULL_45_35]OHA34906.1 MAG: hypothetical protein A3A22_02970 [Candidatus Taylorbacteria bacterium RIFCSPLOWO2_01_FULL_45_34b]